MSGEAVSYRIGLWSGRSGESGDQHCDLAVAMWEEQGRAMLASDCARAVERYRYDAVIHLGQSSFELHPVAEVKSTNRYRCHMLQRTSGRKKTCVYRTTTTYHYEPATEGGQGREERRA